MSEFVTLNPSERLRTYVFISREGLTRLQYKDVTRVRVSKSGNHRLELLDGTKVIVMAGWAAIELDVDTWSL